MIQQHPRRTRTNKDEQPDLIPVSESSPIAKNAADTGEQLAEASDDLYQRTGRTPALLRAPEDGLEVVSDPVALMSILAERIPNLVFVTATGKTKGRIPDHLLRVVLRHSQFLSHFKPVDRITIVPMFLPSWQITMPGYNDGGEHHRILYSGENPTFSSELTNISRFLDVMDFPSAADRANTVAATVTVLLRNFWPGGKPIVVISSTKSHSGKETLVQFICNQTTVCQLSYTSKNWATELSLTRALKHCPDAGVIHIGNARLDGRDQFIASAIIERVATDPNPFLFSSRQGESIRIRNDLVFAITTDFGHVSEDIANRSLPIHLEPKGDVLERECAIGNPAHEYLPCFRQHIAAELRGMVQRWVVSGAKPAKHIEHPFSVWARAICGILEANGIDGILENYQRRSRVGLDPVKTAIGTMGAEQPGARKRTCEWAQIAQELGLTKVIIASPCDSFGTAHTRTRGMGVALSKRDDETTRRFMSNSTKVVFSCDSKRVGECTASLTSRMGSSANRFVLAVPDTT